MTDNQYQQIVNDIMFDNEKVYTNYDIEWTKLDDGNKISTEITETYEFVITQELYDSVVKMCNLMKIHKELVIPEVKKTKIYKVFSISNNDMTIWSSTGNSIMRSIKYGIYSHLLDKKTHLTKFDDIIGLTIKHIGFIYSSKNDVKLKELVVGKYLGKDNISLTKKKITIDEEFIKNLKKEIIEEVLKELRKS